MVESGMILRTTVLSRRKISPPVANNNASEAIYGTGTGILPVIWFDMTIRIVLGVWFAFSAGAYFMNGFTHLQKIDPQQPYLAQAVDGLSIMAIGLYSFFIGCLYAIRLRPVSKFAGFVPALTAILGGFLVSGLILLNPRTDLPVAAKIISCSLILAGYLFAVVALHCLGRSFSILPEGRELVTAGPYHFIRHPLYAAEAIAMLGAMIDYLSPAAVALVATQFLLQLGRIHYEEKVLRTTFPEYAAYSRRTARLIPGIY